MHALTNKAWKAFTYTYIALTVINVFARDIFIDPNVFTAQNYVIHVITKPMIMLLIICFAMKYLIQKEHHNWLLVGFTYSLLGDILIMGQDINNFFFVGGVVSFLIAYLSYIVHFKNSAGGWLGLTPATRVLQVMVFLFSTSYYLVLFSHLGGLWALVLLYQITITIMGVTALGRFGRVNFEAYIYTVIGTLGLIMTSGIFSYNKFISIQDASDIHRSIITLSYCFAQYMVLKGFVALRNPQPSGV